MAAKQLERIRMPPRDEFFRDYVYPHRPVIITNLFEGDSIRQVTTLEEATEAFGGALLPLRREYTSAPMGETPTRVMSFGDYWKMVRAEPSTSWMCTEAEVPARVLSLFTLPEVCKAPPHPPEEILSLPRRCGDHDLLLNVFVGNRGNVAHLHYDGDQREVFLHQVFGTKEVVLFPPNKGVGLEPLTSLVWSGVSLQSMTSAQRMEFIEANGGYCGTLYPGQTVYMPMLIWHFLEYTQDAMSFNIRFGRNRYSRFLSVDHFHRDYYIQNMGIHFRDQTLGNGRYTDAFDEIVAEYVRPAESRRAKISRIRELYRRLCRSHCPEARIDEYCPPEKESAELDKIVKFVDNTMRYASPEVIAKSRPVGPISSDQLRHIDQAAKKHGYDDRLLRKLMLNRVGKVDPRSLSRAEASQFLSYLGSPGAAH
jgi:lysine-specific demethylase 8